MRLGWSEASVDMLPIEVIPNLRDRSVVRRTRDRACSAECPCGAIEMVTEEI